MWSFTIKILSVGVDLTILAIICSTASKNGKLVTSFIVKIQYGD